MTFVLGFSFLHTFVFYNWQLKSANVLIIRIGVYSLVFFFCRCVFFSTSMVLYSLNILYCLEIADKPQLEIHIHFVVVNSIFQARLLKINL